MLFYGVITEEIRNKYNENVLFILELIALTPDLTRQNFADILGISLSTIEKNIQKLKDANLIGNRNGQNRPLENNRTTMKFTEAQLEQAFINLLQEEDMTHVVGGEVRKIEFNGVSEPPTAYGHVVSEKVLVTDDLRAYLRLHYAAEHSTENEIASIVRDLERLPSSDLYETNKTIMKMVSDDFLLKREDRSQKDIYIQLIDYSEADETIKERKLPAQLVQKEKHILQLETILEYKEKEK